MEHPQLDSGEWARMEQRLGGAAVLEKSARKHKALRRRRGVRDATGLLRLSLMYGPGGQSLRSTAALASAAGIAELSDVGVLRRLRGAGDWLEALCQERFAQIARALAPRVATRPIRLIDGSRIEGPGATGWRLHLCFAPEEGRMVQAAITPLKQGERLDRLAAGPGELWIGDRGYPQPDGLRATLAAGADVLVRLTWNSLRLIDAKQRPLDWPRLFEKAARRGRLDMAVRVTRARGSFKPLPLRLVMIRKPLRAADTARRKAQRASQKGQHRKTDPRTLDGAGFLILLTSLDRKAWSPRRLGKLYGVRWQVELAIKRMKSLLHIDELRAKDPALARAWLYAHLLFALQTEAVAAALDTEPP
jgi:hypothetical protein